MHAQYASVFIFIFGVGCVVPNDAAVYILPAPIKFSVVLSVTSNLHEVLL